MLYIQMDKEDTLISYINELKKVLIEQGKILDGVKGIYSPYLDRDIEHMRNLREQVLEKLK